MFGGIEVDAVETPAGFRRLGVETIPPLLCRGVLLDVCGHKGASLLPAKYAITADDLAGCAAAQGVEVRSGRCAAGADGLRRSVARRGRVSGSGRHGEVGDAVGCRARRSSGRGRQHGMGRCRTNATRKREPPCLRTSTCWPKKACTSWRTSTWRPWLTTAIGSSPSLAFPSNSRGPPARPCDRWRSSSAHP